MSILIENLNKSYGKDLVLNNLNLEIKEASLFGLLGPNGAGKTTLISILNSLIPKDSGKVTIYGKDLDKDNNYIKSICSFVPQTYAFYPQLSAYENLEFFGALYGLKGKNLKNNIAKSINITSLEKYASKKAYTFSGGLKRRLNIAIGLLNEPKVLYLDEPTVGIDPQSRSYILDMIKQINEENKTTIIYTSHYMEEIEYLCDEIAILDKGNIILQEEKDILVERNSALKIELNNEEIKTIAINKSYDDFVDYLLELRNKNLSIKNIDFGYKNLEEMFLSLTKKDLRD